MTCLSPKRFDTALSSATRRPERSPASSASLTSPSLSRRAAARRAAVLPRLRGVADAPGRGQPELVVLQGEESADLVAALNRLSPSDQELIRLAGWEELDRDALALAVGCTANAATKRLNRSLDRLGRELGVSDRVRGRFFRRKKVAS